MAKFETAYKLTCGQEGGYSNSSHDKGGETYRGISRKWFPEWKGWKVIDSYKANHDLQQGEYINDFVLEELVYDFFEAEFWDANRLSEITSQEIANEVYDTAVNMGKNTAAVYLQKAVNLLNRNQKDYNDIKVDGHIGTATLSLVNRYPNSAVLIKVLNGLQFACYLQICEKDPDQEYNFRGWLNRV
ncbi:MAG TPA: glycosyl hydrolase 108 family protein [Lentimicrobium sp.]|nr:glycosyl hydrolase 108 family protein [Bacteroidales bacterium]HLO92449.1 glycosyl hydrolase 108 family protein [Lentimicrobium sp.]